MTRRVVEALEDLEVKLRWGLGGIPQLRRVIMSALFLDWWLSTFVGDFGVLLGQLVV
jgi:hypothetical protein